MKWFNGTIAEAVNATKQRNATFVVFVKGNDELTTKMSSVLDVNEISQNLGSLKFVCIQLQNDSEGHKQFIEIYKLVPVPSLFFINGQNGLPLEIIAGESNEENLKLKLSNAIAKCTSIGIESQPPATTSQQISSTPSVNQESGNIQSTPAEVQPVSSELSYEEREAKVKQKMKMAQEAKRQKDEKERKDKEMDRRRVGHELAEAKRKQKDREIDELLRERQREKKEEREARERVLRQIEEDKKKREELATPVNIQRTEIPNIPVIPSQTIEASETRIQFKLPDGQTNTNIFPIKSTILDVRRYIDTNIKLPFRDYKLAITFPRKEFSQSDDNQLNLQDLGLFPSAVMLILPINKTNSVTNSLSWSRTFTNIFWGILQPALNIIRYVQNFIFGQRNNGGNADAAEFDRTRSRLIPPRSTTENPRTQSRLVKENTTIKRRGNIHSLKDPDDSNDETNTWNGNSTQQM